MELISTTQESLQKLAPELKVSLCNHSEELDSVVLAQAFPPSQNCSEAQNHKAKVKLLNFRLVAH